jgi:eukaryotic-like serine/threonine-protein kinase
VQLGTPTVIGRYTLFDAIGAGGMATVHLARLAGDASFARTVAVKRLHPRYAADPQFVTMFLDEARLAARIKHPNVVPILDVVSTADELFLVMDYVAGESLYGLMAKAREHAARIPVRVGIAVVSDVLHGLHAAHEAKSERGAPLAIVHRDVSPQNILVGADGQTRILDFGVAKARGQTHTTGEGQLKGKLRYMAPEQLEEGSLTPAADIYATGIVLWEILTGRRMFGAETDVGVVGRILEGRVAPPSSVAAGGAEAEADERSALQRLDAIVLKALAREPARRFSTAREMAQALEEQVPRAPVVEVAEWVEATSKEALDRRAELVAEIERDAVGAARGPTVLGSDEATAIEPSPSRVAPDAPPLSPAAPPVSRRRFGVVGVGVVAVALVVALGAALVLVARPRSGPTSQGSPPASALSGAPSASNAPATQPPAPPSSSTPVASAPAPASGKAGRKPAGGGVPTAPRRADPCKPPFVWDEQGVKHYKPECM